MLVTPGSKLDSERLCTKLIRIKASTTVSARVQYNTFQDGLLAISKKSWVGRDDSMLPYCTGRSLQ
jgi:hypothetical protein